MKLFNYHDCLNLNISQIKKSISKNINSSQVKLISSFSFGNEVPLKAEGVFIQTNKRKVLDMTGGIGVLNHGHNHPDILKVRKLFSETKQMEVHKNFFSKFLVGLVNNLSYILPSDIKYFYFPNSGAEAVDGAVKLAYKYHNGKRDYILHSNISFHGKLIGAGSLTASNETSGFDFQKIKNTRSFKYNDFKSLEKLVKKLMKNNKSNIYAIIVEPFSGQTCKELSNNFLNNLRKICSKNNIVLIFDEIYSGFCKTGKIFNFQRVKGLTPDIVTFSKSFGGGKASISGYGIKEKFHKEAYDNMFDATLHSTTYYGFGEESVSAMEAINIMIRDRYEEKSLRNGILIKNNLKNLKEKYTDLIGEFRGSGSVFGIKFNNKNLLKIIQDKLYLIPNKFFKDKFFADKLIAASIIEELYFKYSILTYFAINEDIIFKISPPVIIKKKEIDYFFDSLDKCLKYGLYKLIIKFLRKKYFV